VRERRPSASTANERGLRVRQKIAAGPAAVKNASRCSLIGWPEGQHYRGVVPTFRSAAEPSQGVFLTLYGAPPFETSNSFDFPRGMLSVFHRAPA
jgi:hypothetical protein